MDEANNEITIYSHAPIGLREIALMAIKLKVEPFVHEPADNSPKEDDETLINKINKTDLPKLIDGMNQEFLEGYVKNNKVSELYSSDDARTGYCGRADFKGSTRDNIFTFIQWNRMYGGLDCRRSFPNGMKLRFVHGHDDPYVGIDYYGYKALLAESNEEAKIDSLDNLLGKRHTGSRWSYEENAGNYNAYVSYDDNKFVSYRDQMKEYIDVKRKKVSYEESQVGSYKNKMGRNRSVEHNRKPMSLLAAFGMALALETIKAPPVVLALRHFPSVIFSSSLATALTFSGIGLLVGGCILFALYKKYAASVSSESGSNLWLAMKNDPKRILGIFVAAAVTAVPVVVLAILHFPALLLVSSFATNFIFSAIGSLVGGFILEHYWGPVLGHEKSDKLEQAIGRQDKKDKGETFHGGASRSIPPKGNHEHGDKGAGGDKTEDGINDNDPTLQNRSRKLLINNGVLSAGRGEARSKSEGISQHRTDEGILVASV